MEDSNNSGLSFRDILDASAANLSSGSVLTVTDVLVGLFASLLCAAIISWTYRETYQGVLYQKSFNHFYHFNLFSNYRSDNGYKRKFSSIFGNGGGTFNSKISSCDKGSIG